MSDHAGNDPMQTNVDEMEAVGVVVRSIGPESLADNPVQSKGCRCNRSKAFVRLYVAHWGSPKVPGEYLQDRTARNTGELRLQEVRRRTAATGAS